MVAAVMVVGTQAARKPTEADERSFRAAVFLIFAITVLRLLWLASGATELYPDEAQYWVWSLHPAWGYYSKPPVVAWLIAATTALAGSNNELAVRLAAPLLQFGTALMVYALAQRLYDARIAFWSSLAYATLPGVWVSAVIISTDAPLLFCWSIALYAFVRAREPGGGRWWIAVGVAAGIGLLSKYAMAYWLISGLLFLMIYRDERRHLRGYAAATLLALAVYAPNFAWNALNGFVSYHHTEANAAFGGTLFHPSSFLAFFGSQFGVFGPVFFAALILCAGLGARTLKGRNEAMLAMFALPTLVMMLVVSFLSRAQPNWSAPTYVSAVILVVWMMLVEGQRLLVLGSILFNVAAVTTLAELRPVSRALGYDLPGKYDPLHRLNGWRSLGLTVGRMLLENPGTLLLADDRELMASLIYYVPQHPLDGLKWNAMGGIHDQFDLEAHPESMIGKDFLLVSYRNSVDDVVSRFAEVGPEQHITVSLGGGVLRTYQVRLLHGFKGYPAP
jgi:4-amino-4-deoxy-L-arabinose transferase-like glycosyltransferase